MKIKELNTSLNAFEIFTAIKDEKFPVFLDSSLINNLGKYSIIACNPFIVFKNKDDEICVDDSLKKESFTGNPFDELNKIYLKFQKKYDSDLPFIGGGIGFFAYDLQNHLEKLPKTAIDDINTCDLVFGFYDGAIIIDHFKNKVFITDAMVNKGEKEREIFIKLI